MWLFEAPSHYVFLYVYKFNLEYGGSSCPYDYLEIRDGNSPSSPVITKSCGSLYYLRIYSSSRFLFVRFHSNGYTQMPGFDAYCYESYGGKKKSIPIFPSCCYEFHFYSHTWVLATKNRFRKCFPNGSREEISKATDGQCTWVAH